MALHLILSRKWRQILFKNWRFLLQYFRNIINLNSLEFKYTFLSQDIIDLPDYLHIIIVKYYRVQATKKSSVWEFLFDTP